MLGIPADSIIVPEKLSRYQIVMLAGYLLCSRVTGHVVLARFHFSGNRVYQESGSALPRNSAKTLSSASRGKASPDIR
jgi:hypothetical protein